MNKRVIFFMLACFITTSSTTLLAMNKIEEIDQTKYSFVKFIKPEWANDLITFVKELPDGNCVFFDRKGDGEYLTNNESRELKGLEDYSLYNIFSYTKNDQALLVVSEDKKNKLYVYNLNEKRLSWVRTIKFDYKIALYQLANDDLVMFNLDDDKETSVMQIDLQWDDAQSFGKEVVITKKSLSESPKYEKNDGVVASTSTLYDKKKPRLDENMFDISSLTDEDAKWVTTKSYPHNKRHIRGITCYHETPKKIMYCGHDWGIVSIWKPKE